MAVRFRHNWTSEAGTPWQIDIHDTQYTGTVIPFDTDGGTLKSALRGENQERHSPFLNSEIKFVMQVYEEHEPFISDLATSPEGRFSVVLYENGSLSSVGVILSDIARIEDLYYPYGFAVTATDGLAILKTIPYRDENGPYSGEARIITHIANCLKKIPHVPTWWGSAANFIRTSVEYYEENFDTFQDPLWQTWANHRTFYKVDTDGEATYVDAYTVLQTCLEVFGARLFQAGGVWWVESVEARAGEGDVFSFTYPYAIAEPSLINTRQVVPVGSGTDFDKMRGGYWTFFPALRSASIEYEAFDRYNLVAGKTFSHTQPQVSIALDRVNSNSGKARLKLTGQLSARLRNTNQPNTPSPVAVWFQLRIKVGDKYLKRKANVVDYAVSYEQMEWKDSVEYVDVLTNFYTVPYIPSVWAGYIEEPIDIVTPELPTSAEIEFYFHFFILAGQGGANVPGSFYDLNWTLANPWLEVYSNGSPDLKGNGRIYTKTNSVEANTESYKTTVYLGDGPSANTVSRLKRILPTGNEWVDTGKWGKRTGPRTLPLLELVAERILRGQLTARHKMYATFQTAVGVPPLSLFAKIEHRGIAYLLLSIEHDLSKEQYTGEWFEVSYDESTPVESGVTKGKEGLSTPGGSLPGGTTTTTSTNARGVGCACLSPIAATTLSTQSDAGAVTMLSVSDLLSKNAFLVGEVIVVMNPASGQFAALTVTAPVLQGDNTVQVSGNLPGNMPVGSYVLSGQKNAVAQAGALANLNGITRISAPLASGQTSVDIEAGSYLLCVWVLSAPNDNTVRIGTSANGEEVLSEVVVPAGGGLTHPAHYPFEWAGTIYITSSEATSAILYLARE